MKFAFKNILFTLFAIGNLYADERPILITYYEHEQTAKWIQTVMAGPNINAPEALVELRKIEKPCTQVEERMVQICVNEKGSFELVQVDNKDTKQAFGHLVSELEVEDPKASKEWQAIWDQGDESESEGRK